MSRFATTFSACGKSVTGTTVLVKSGNRWAVRHYPRPAVPWSVGDPYDNALAETINGLYKAEVIHKNGPWKGLDDVERATLTGVEWLNNRRRLRPIGDGPPAEYEMLYYQTESSEAA